ncbi:hypothetical protein F4809DRAFT_618777 [Biscogniauxia mediterranea]|nr:hypothetical protein F4809DRAFT_618777 [Biscogniauxia mediterranea]
MADDDQPTHNPPWPGMTPFAQGRIERKFFEDGATIHFDQLPKVQFWGQLLFIRESFYVLSILKKVTDHSVGAQRRLTATEVDAVSEHAARSVRQFAWTQPVSIAAAAGFAWFRRATFKFPFYQPKRRTFDPYSFPSRTWPLVNGPRAVMLWHFLRFVAYCPLCWLGTATYLTSTSEASFRAHMMRDPRLNKLINDINQSRTAQLRGMVPEQMRRAGHPQGDGASRFPAPQQPVNPSHPASHDYGSGAFGPRSGDASERPDSTAEQTPNWARTPLPPATPRNPQWSNPPEHDPQHEINDDSGLFDDDDDMSPVAPSARRTDAKQSQNVSSESPWERLRQQAQAAVQNRARGDSRQGRTQPMREASPKSDDFSYSSQDEEKERRRYEKEQAQRDFDALLEAERRGESSNEGWRRSK